MNLKNIITGIQILQPYYDKPDGYHLGAEHDAIYLYKTDRPLSPEDIQKMLDAGWFQEDAEYEDDMKVENYDPEESWTAYV